jgi:hypothetical protein
MLVLVRGVGDIESAVAHHLFQEGYGVVLPDDPEKREVAVLCLRRAV